MAGIYIHIPFCHSKCAYCDFFSTSGSNGRATFVESLSREWAMRRHELGDAPVRTIYLGGGTPSILSTDELNIIASLLPVSKLEEFTLEANPEDISIQRVKDMISIGINRISIGVQSLNDRELQAVGRCHTSQDAIEAIATIRKAGISNISADLIYGLPEQTADSWRESVQRLSECGITHLSAYALSYEPGTRLYSMLRAGKIKEASQELSEEMYNILCETMARQGFLHYEISNFAIPGMHSRHNSSYWDYTPYLGLGPGAHSFDGQVRRVNPSRLQSYNEAMMAGRIFYETEEETPVDRLNDIIITAMRTKEGLCMEKFRQAGGDFALTRLKRNANVFIKSGRIVCTDTSMYIPERYWLVSDAILRELLID